MRSVNILGDLTDAKDNHPADLVNRTVREFTLLKQKCPDLSEINVLAGNHDWLKSGQEFFRFLSVIPGVRFITEASETSSRSDRGVASAYWLPYSKNPARDYAQMDFSHYEYLNIHQTVMGAVSSNGERMDGEVMPPLNAMRVFSGDIHVPQVVKVSFGTVKYIGSPYHVHFGDDFKPRCVLVKQDRSEHDLNMVSPRRVTLKVATLREVQRYGLREGDQVKLRLELDASERHGWARLRREATAILRDLGCEPHGVELVSAGSAAARVDPAESRAARDRDPRAEVFRFVEREELGGDALDAALDVLDAE